MDRVKIDYELDGISARRQAFDRAVVGSLGAALGFAIRHWLLLLNLALFLVAGLAMLAPALMYWGYELPAQAIYFFFKFTCHQWPFRSYFLFGPQAVYSFEEMQALAGPEQVYSFVGNSLVGFKMAYCQRNFAIYTTVFLGTLFYTLLRGRVRPLSWRLYLVLIAPLALDGLTQLVGWRESTWELRTITGALFGVATVWLCLPLMDRAMKPVQEAWREG